MKVGQCIVLFSYLCQHEGGTVHFFVPRHEGNKHGAYA